MPTSSKTAKPATKTAAKPTAAAATTEAGELTKVPAKAAAKKL